MHLFHIPQRSIQNRNVHISVMIETLWDTEHVHSGICEIVGLLIFQADNKSANFHITCFCAPINDRRVLFTINAEIN